jgi:hypothetical protein
MAYTCIGAVAPVEVRCGLDKALKPVGTAASKSFLFRNFLNSRDRLSPYNQATVQLTQCSSNLEQCSLDTTSANLGYDTLQIKTPVKGASCRMRWLQIE